MNSHSIWADHRLDSYSPCRSPKFLGGHLFLFKVLQESPLPPHEASHIKKKKQPLSKAKLIPNDPKNSHKVRTMLDWYLKERPILGQYMDRPDPKPEMAPPNFIRGQPDRGGGRMYELEADVILVPALLKQEHARCLCIGKEVKRCPSLEM